MHHFSELTMEWLYREIKYSILHWYSAIASMFRFCDCLQVIVSPTPKWLMWTWSILLCSVSHLVFFLWKPLLHLFDKQGSWGSESVFGTSYFPRFPCGLITLLSIQYGEKCCFFWRIVTFSTLQTEQDGLPSELPDMIISNLEIIFFIGCVWNE